jgi:uncharacterized protein involved in outer membrane biogenesis
MKKVLITLLVIVVAVVVVFSFVKNSLVKTALVNGIESATGLQTQVRSVNFGILRSLIDIKGIEIANPQGFGTQKLAKIPRIYVDADLGALLRKELHFKEVALEIEEIHIVKNKKGEFNVDTIRSIITPKPEKPKSPGDEPATKKEPPPQEMPEFSIDILAFKLGKIVYSEPSEGAKGSKTEIKLNINERYENVTSLESLIQMVIEKSFIGGALNMLEGIEGGSFKQKGDQIEKKFKDLGDDFKRQYQEGQGEDTEQFEDDFKSEIDKLQDSFKGIFKTE